MNSTKDKRKAYRRFKAAIMEMADAVDDLSQLSEKELKWVVPRMKRTYSKLDQRIENALSNVEKKTDIKEKIYERPKDPADDLPF